MISKYSTTFVIEDLHAVLDRERIPKCTVYWPYIDVCCQQKVIIFHEWQKSSKTPQDLRSSNITEIRGDLDRAQPPLWTVQERYSPRLNQAIHRDGRLNKKYKRNKPYTTCP
jgi:hypothetical protein